MILTCPSCATRFLIEAQQLGPEGRTVRCGRCGHSWHQMAPAEEDPPLLLDQEAVVPERMETPLSAQPSEFDEDKPSVKDISPKVPQKKKAQESGGMGLAFGWLLFFAVVAGLLAALWYGRAEVLRYFPQAAQFYEMVGLESGVDTASELGLEVRELSTVRRLVNGERRMIVEGIIANTTEDSIEVPELEARLTSPSGEVAVAWAFQSDQRVLPPGATSRFETFVTDPPNDATGLTVEFKENDATGGDGN